MPEGAAEPSATRTRPEWVVQRQSEDPPRVTYRLVDVAGTGVAEVGIRCSGCTAIDLAASVPLADGACEFTVAATQSPRRPEITVTWAVGGGYSARWSTTLP